MKNSIFSKILWILYYIFIFFLLLNHSHGYLDPDLGWHLKVGQQILEEKAVPSLNYYNFTLEGQTWVDHEWLMNATTYWFYDNLGYLAVNIFFALIVLAILIILHYFTQKHILKGKNSAVFIIFFQMLGLIASLPHLGVRIQEITVLNVLILLIIIYFYEKNKNWKILLWLPPLFYFWANIHAGFLIGVFIMFFWASVKIFEIIIKKYFIPHRKGSRPLTITIKQFFERLTHQDDNLRTPVNIKHIGIFFVFIILVVLSTLLTPYGFKLYAFLSDYSNTFYLKHIGEWLPFYYLPILYWQLLYQAFVIIVIALITINFFHKNKSNIDGSGPERGKINLWDLAITILFLVLTFKSKRHFPLLFIASFPMMIKFFSSFLNLPDKLTSLKRWPKQFLLVKFYLIVGLLIIISSQLIGIKLTKDPFSSFGSVYPKNSVAWLKNNPELSPNLFSQYSWGGYLIWALPEKKLFIDGRLPQLPFAGHTFLEEYYEFFEEEKIEEKISQYDISLILLKSKKDEIRLNWFEKYFLLFNEEEINNYKRPLKNYLESSPEWYMAYNDDIGSIYVKR